MIRFELPENVPETALLVELPPETDEADAKRALLSALAVALEFPPWFGENWDALADALGDVRTPLVVALKHATSAMRTHPHVVATFIELWADEARTREARGEYFGLLLLL